MPADSERAASRPGVPPLPRTWRPLGPRIVGIVVLGGLAAVCASAWLSFSPKTRAEFTGFQIGTLLFFGALICVLMYALLRSRAELHRDRLVVVNGYKHREFDWAQIVAVRLPPGAPWVTLDLADGNVVAVMGIQSSDGQRARVALHELRAMVSTASSR